MSGWYIDTVICLLRVRRSNWCVVCVIHRTTPTCIWRLSTSTAANCSVTCDEPENWRNYMHNYHGSYYHLCIQFLATSFPGEQSYVDVQIVSQLLSTDCANKHSYIQKCLYLWKCSRFFPHNLQKRRFGPNILQILLPKFDSKIITAWTNVCHYTQVGKSEFNIRCFCILFIICCYIYITFSLVCIFRITDESTASRAVGST